MEKAQAFVPYYESGSYTSDFGSKGLRILTVVATRTQASTLWRTASRFPLAELFWFSDQESVCAEPLSAHWLVGGSESLAPLV